ncbi:extracellular calcium-sensing receptor-like [Protopterus annectens]|uniref:extracellular calcium-sensing receptor-like n=1 Tax=Protopterus annectens TaxID=7888 RepID=UPI001CFC21F9|nr:extracellular calcium-sensing receptor-like [Protopterus annectens]
MGNAPFVSGNKFHCGGVEMLSLYHPAAVMYCRFTTPAYQMAQGMVFATEEINKSPNLLPNITLGFGIYDSCDIIVKALEGTLWLLSGQVGPAPNYQCRSKSNVVAIVGDSRSQVSIPMARILGLYRYPQVSYASGALSLSDKRVFPSFVRSLPSTYLKYSAFARMLTHFRWTWVGILAEDDDYGQQVSQVLREKFAATGICVEFFETLPVIDMDKKMDYLINVIKKSTANAVVITSSDSRLYPLLVEMSRKNITGKVWLGSDEWPYSILFARKDLFPILQGAIWFSVHSSTLPGFKEFLDDINPLKNSNDPFTKQFWETTFICKWPKTESGAEISVQSEDGTPTCTGKETLKGLDIAFLDVLHLGFTYNTYLAIYAVAHALHNMHSCILGNGPFVNGSCAKHLNFEPWQLLHYIKSVHFYDSMGEEFYLDATGNPPDVYDILNWQITQQETVNYVIIGSFDSRFPYGQDLRINASAIMWTGVQKKVPTSHCSDSCLPGFRKASQQGRPICCFLCIPCSEGEISNQTDSTDCQPCSSDFWPDEKRETCIQKSIEYLSYEDPLGTVLAFISAFSALLPAAILVIFIKNHDTPVVKANNRDISYVLLIALILCFLCSLIFIGQPNSVTCMLRQVAFGIVFVLCVSCVLAKTIMVVIAFKATNPNSRLKNWVGSTLPNTIVFISVLIQCIICSSWLISSPPFPERNITFQMGKIIIQCNEGSPFAFWCMLGYMGLLTSISLIVAFLSRNLPDSFNEAKFITFSMIVFASVWLSFIPAYLSTQGKFMVAVEIFAIFSSSAGLLACIFLPKCYIILLKPHQNTREYLMGKGAHGERKM